jgi:flagellar biosynthetic protein FlhB
LIEFFKALLKLAVVSGIVWIFLTDRIPRTSVLWDLEPAGIMRFIAENVLWLMFSVGLGFLVLAGFDYGWQRFRYEQKLKMTKQEAKEDRKQQEGNPQIRARIRMLQRKAATSRMMEAVKTADVVVTNPTHIAVALLYDRENMHAPRVVAKGADFMAEKIKKVAREAGIPCVENRPLARALYKAFKIGQFVSRDLYNAVAEVLAYVYRLKGRWNL